MMEEADNQSRIKLDFEKARKLLVEQAHEAKSIAPHGVWIERVRRLSELCKTSSKTPIAVLGTAILAKATSLDIDPFALKSSDSRRGYSARNLAKLVLAAEAKQLGIDLGVSSPEPLQNRPFSGKSRVSLEWIGDVKGNARPTFEYLIECLTALDRVSTQKESILALRSFIQARESKRVQIVVDEGEGSNLDQSDILALIDKFIRGDSEFGKRAQVVAAGLLDTLVGQNRVRTSRIHDPSRKYPGDIAILSATSKDPERVFEVKDKPITEADLRTFVQRAKDAGVLTVGMLAVAADQPDIEVGEINRWAETRSVRLAVYFGWQEFVREVFFWTSLHSMPVGAAYRAILSRAETLEVSDGGIELWRNASNT